MNVSAFYNNYNNLQLVVTSCPNYTPDNAPAPCAMTTNAGDAHIKGVELETAFRPFAGLSINGSVSYLNFDYTRLNATVSGVALSNIAPFMSRQKWSVGVQYEAGLPGGSSITPRVDVSHQSEFYSSASNSDLSLVPGYTVANAGLTWSNAKRDLDVALRVTNLTDKYCLLGAFENLQAGFATAQPARPREWTVTLAKRLKPHTGQTPYALRMLRAPARCSTLRR